MYLMRPMEASLNKKTRDGTSSRVEKRDMKAAFRFTQSSIMMMMPTSRERIAQKRNEHEKSNHK